jgi:hypothetical protein
MSFAVNEVSRLLAAERARLGVVVGFSGTLAIVATARGAVLARPAGTVAKGNRVIVRDGWVEPAPVASVTYQV